MMRELNHLRVARSPVYDWVQGETVAMKRIAADLSRVAPTNATVQRVCNRMAAARDLPGRFTAAQLLSLVDAAST